MGMVEFLALRYGERCSRLGQLVNGCPSHPRKVHVFLSQSRFAKLPCPAPEVPCPARPVDLFGSLPDSITQALGVELRRHKLVGHHLTCWEADLVSPHWLTVWAGWHARWALQGFSDLEVPDLETRRRQISTASALYESSTMVGDSSEDSVPWQVEFFRRPETVSGGDFDGNCVFVCGSHFDWAGVFLLAMAFSIPTICGMDSSSVHRPPMEATTGSLLLVAGQQERFVVPLLVTGLQDPLVTVILVVAPDDWCLP